MRRFELLIGEHQEQDGTVYVAGDVVETDQPLATMFPDRFWPLDAAPAGPPCQFCQHYQPGKGQRCKAYPAGVPAGILDRTTAHNEPLEGQVGDYTYLSRKVFDLPDGRNYVAWDGQRTDQA